MSNSEGQNALPPTTGPSRSKESNPEENVSDGLSAESIQFIQQLVNIEVRSEAGLPSPAALAAFEQIHAGLADRIVTTTGRRFESACEVKMKFT